MTRSFTRRGALAAAGSLLATPFLPTPGRAQDAYPNRPIRLIIGFTPGGPTDIVARSVAALMQERLGQPFVIDNRPGAGSNLAADAVRRAAPDGYTLLATNNASHGANPALFQNIGFDAVTDFRHIAGWAHVTNVLAVHPSMPARSMQEFVELARARPGAISYGSATIGSAGHLAAELLRQRTGIDIQHVAYRGAAPMMQDVLAGTTQVVFATLQGVLGPIRAGNLRALGITAPERIPQLPDVPTFAETVAPGFSADGWYGLSGPAGLPDSITRRLAEASAAATADAGLRTRLVEAGFRVTPMGPDAFTRFVAEEVRKLGEVVRLSGARVE